MAKKRNTVRIQGTQATEKQKKTFPCRSVSGGSGPMEGFFFLVFPLFSWRLQIIAYAFTLLLLSLLGIYLLLLILSS